LAPKNLPDYTPEIKFDKKKGMKRKMFHSFTDSTHDIHKVNKITIVAERYLI
jgi:hypothetical protein